jgi:hypothetical protein
MQLELSVKSGQGLTYEGKKKKKRRNCVSLNDKLVLIEWKEKNACHMNIT